MSDFTESTNSVYSLVERLASECRDAVTDEIADAAAAATRAAFGNPTLTCRLERRVTAYYRAVVRRRVLRRGGPKDAAARMVVAAVVDDLVRAGRPRDAVIEELERGWSDKVPAHVLDEFRTRLCA